MSTPPLTVILLTWNEEQNIARCLASLAAQRAKDFEIIVVDAASTDRTVEIIEAVRPTLPVPLRLEVASRRLPIGEARNLGVAKARADLVAFVSADSELDVEWVQRALGGLRSADLVFGRQMHEPHEWTIGAAVRGLRYHFPAHVTDQVLRFASNVAAAYRKEVLVQHPFDPWANAAEDLLIARRAVRDGYIAAYDPRMIVRHHDVATIHAEWRKNVREGEGCATYADELGLMPGFLAWGALLVGTLFVVPLNPKLGAVLFAGALWGPALRRAVRHLRDMPFPQIVKGVVASPVFDLAFLFHYVRGLLRRREGRRPAPIPLETQE